MKIEDAILAVLSCRRSGDWKSTTVKFDIQEDLSDEFLSIVLDALRSKQEEEKNDPLTMAELLKMDGEPVWVVPNNPKRDAQWCIMDMGIAFIGGTDHTFFDEYEYMKDGNSGWVAYRRPPDR